LAFGAAVTGGLRFARQVLETQVAPEVFNAGNCSLYLSA